MRIDLNVCATVGILTHRYCVLIQTVIRPLPHTQSHTSDQHKGSLPYLQLNIRIINTIIARNLAIKNNIALCDVYCCNAIHMTTLESVGCSKFGKSLL